MAHYLSIHHEPSVTRDKVESRWIDLANERRAVWVKTWFNHDLGKRFCWWDAPGAETLETVFRDHGVTWEEIIKVDVTTPSDWRWRED